LGSALIALVVLMVVLSAIVMGSVVVSFRVGMIASSTK